MVGDDVPFHLKFDRLPSMAKWPSLFYFAGPSRLITCPIPAAAQWYNAGVPIIMWWVRLSLEKINFLKIIFNHGRAVLLAIVDLIFVQP